MKRQVVFGSLIAALLYVGTCIVLMSCNSSDPTSPVKKLDSADSAIHHNDSVHIADSLKHIAYIDSLGNALRPSLQAAYNAMKFGMFIHFNMSTFDRDSCGSCYSVMGEWGTPKENESVFNPTDVDPAWNSVSDSLQQFKPSHSVDCGQWARTAKAAGCKYMILTTKHHDGFCLWPSKYSTHTLAYSSWAGHTRNIVKEFVDSARAYGLEVGMYFSIWDRTIGETPQFNMNQFSELLDTNVYGHIKCLWFDGWAWEMGYRRMPYTTLKRCIKGFQPTCLIVENNHLHSLDSTDLMEYEFPVEGLIPASNTLPGEGAIPFRADNLWFWHPNKQCEMKSVTTVLAELNQVNNAHGNVLLDVTPDQSGNIPACICQQMAAVGAAWPGNPYK
jgi:alpha-L-fucosidase